MVPIPDIFAAPGHEDIVTTILWHLGWRSLLAAAATCRNLNRVVTSTSSLQVELRAQYYGLPDWYAQRLKSKRTSPETMSRMMDIQTRWATLSPKAVHVMTRETLAPLLSSFGRRPNAPYSDGWYGKPLISNGLFVNAKTSLRDENALDERDPGAAPERDQYEGGPSPHRRRRRNVVGNDDGDTHINIGWVVTDLSGSRDVASADNLLASAPNNAVAIVTSRVGQYKPQLGGTLIYGRVHVYLAENDGCDDLKGINVPVPHPEAHGVTEVCGLHTGSFLDDHNRQWGPEWGVRLSPGGVAEVGLMERNGWAAIDWRTGQWLTHTDCQYDHDTLHLRFWYPMLRGEAQLLFDEVDGSVRGDVDGEHDGSSKDDIACSDEGDAEGRDDKGDLADIAAADDLVTNRAAVEKDEKQDERIQGAMTGLAPINSADPATSSRSNDCKRRFAVLRIEQALAPTHPLSAPTGPLGHPGTIEGYAELPCHPSLWQEISRLTPQEYKRMGSSAFGERVELDPHGRLLAMSMSLEGSGKEQDAIYFYAVHLTPLRRMMEATAKPPTCSPPPRTWPLDWETASAAKDAGEDDEGLPQYPEPDPPALTSTLTAQDVAPYSDDKRMEPSKVQSHVMGLRAIYLTYKDDPEGNDTPPETFTLYVADYAIPHDGDVVHVAPVGGALGYSEDQNARMVVPLATPQSALADTAITNYDASFRVSAPWDWSHASGPLTLSRHGVAAEIAFDPGNELDPVIGADPEHLYLCSPDAIVVLSF